MIGKIFTNKEDPDYSAWANMHQIIGKKTRHIIRDVISREEFGIPRTTRGGVRYKGINDITFIEHIHVLF